MFDPIIEEHSDVEEHDEAMVSSEELPHPSENAEPKSPSHSSSPANENARKELQTHELLALLSCFLCPAAGAWLLHAIRSQLSRPSEGLVSNYNLTVFLLAAEIRPLSHLIKIIQGRTLYLQRIVTAESQPEQLSGLNITSTEIIDLTKRLEDLESHVADSAVAAETQQQQQQAEQMSNPAMTETAEQLNSDVRAELDALNRAVRKYEKRTTVSAVQTEARLQDLEARLQDAIVLAAAAQRSAASKPNNFILTLLNLGSAVIVLPMQMIWEVTRLPIRAATWALSFTRLPYPGDSKTERSRKERERVRRVRSSGVGMTGKGGKRVM